MEEQDNPDKEQPQSNIEKMYIVMHEDEVSFATVDVFYAYKHVFFCYEVDTPFEDFQRTLEQQNHFSVEHEGYLYDVFVQYRKAHPPKDKRPMNEIEEQYKQQNIRRTQLWEQLYGEHWREYLKNLKNPDTL